METKIITKIKFGNLYRLRINSPFGKYVLEVWKCDFRGFVAVKRSVAK